MHIILSDYTGSFPGEMKTNKTMLVLWCFIIENANIEPTKLGGMYDKSYD